MPAPTNRTIDKQRGILAILARIFWMFIGNFVILICVADIFMGESKSTRTSDIVLWCVVAAVIVVRLLDIKFLDGQTATGEPATLVHWLKYVVVLASLSGAIWAAAHLFES